jgi:hypothetical protein
MKLEKRIQAKVFKIQIYINTCILINKSLLTHYNGSIPKYFIQLLNNTLPINCDFK